MKNLTISNWIKSTIVLVLAIAITMLSFAFAVNAEVAQYDVADYKGERAEAEWIYPTQAGKVFAGWYSDMTFSTPYKGTTGNAYAKFVDAKVLSVKKQIKSSTMKTSLTTNVRFITAIDSLKFASVGFEVSVDCSPAKAFTLSETKAYASVLVDGKTRPETPDSVFGTEKAVYFVMHSITGIPTAAFGNTFTARPYWYTLDGTKVYGATNEFVINNLLDNQITEGQDYVDFTDSINWESNFATRYVDPSDGTVTLSYAKTATVGTATVKNAVRVQASGPWPPVAGFTPAVTKDYCEQFRDGKFCVDFYVNSYYSPYQYDPTPSYVKFFIKYPGSEYSLTNIDHQGKYSIALDPAIILDNWDAFVNGSAMFYFYDGGGNISVDCYFTAMRFELPLPIYYDFTDSENWQSDFATTIGQQYCSYVESATVGTETITNAIRFRQNGEWLNIGGFNTVNHKESYEVYRSGKFVIDMYVADNYSAWGAEYHPHLYFKCASGDTLVGTLSSTGRMSVVMDAATILDNWGSFIFYFADGGGEVHVDCYFTGMYFELPTLTYYDFTDSVNWQSNFATTIGQNNCSYVESTTVGTETITNAIRFRQNGEWLNIGGFNTVNHKESYEVYRSGKFVIDMYVADNYSAWGAEYHPHLYFKCASGDTLVGTLSSTGRMSVVMDAATILDNWGSFIFYFADGGGEVHVDCYFTGMYFEMPTATFMDFTDSTNWQNHFATTNGQQYCSYVESTTVGSDTIENAVRYTASNPESIWLTGITAINHKESYEQYRGGKFVIDMYVASYTGNNPMLNVVVTWPPVERSLVLGHQRIEVDASLVLDSNVNFSLQVWNCDSIDCYITGMYFTEPV